MGLVTLFERHSSCLFWRHGCNTAELTKTAMIRLLKPYWGASQNIVLDNGSEFAEHEPVAMAVTVVMYFSDLYCSGQPGINENTIDLIR